MSDDSNIEVNGEVDASWNSYYDPETHGHMHQNDNSETVDVVESDGGDSGGEITDTWFPDEIDDPDSLTERQRKIITTAVQNRDWSVRDIEEATGFQSADKTLKRHCPNWYNSEFNTGRNITDREETLDTLKGKIKEHGEIKRKKLAKETELSEAIVTKRTNTLAERGLIDKDKGGYNNCERIYIWSGEDNPTDRDDAKSGVNRVEFVQEDTAGETPDNPEWDKFSDDVTAPDTENESEHFTEGDKEALQSLFSTDQEELKAGIEAMKSVATHEETINALEWVEQYL